MYPLTIACLLSVPFSSERTVEPSSLLPSGDGAISIQMAPAEASPAAVTNSGMACQSKKMGFSTLIGMGGEVVCLLQVTKEVE